ncbi:hypothetical protein JVT61DRAFT_8784 [Boletus reticuloceps]|uniref:DUF6593 domain-containing protein n=1 Tax=Boletus reticuloceps TaxID=495285 RepID=A0A8I2YHR8_9AGAM|nr:hypothetical protein JVT61DRAFT_8784 [Boletus reticuloceps]
MRITLSSESVRNAVFTNESGQVLYKTTHPHHIGMGTTTIHKIRPNDDPMDMRDQFDVMGEIEWHVIGSSTFRLNGQEMQSNEFLPSRGILGRFVLSSSEPFFKINFRFFVLYRRRTFTGPDGCPYGWNMVFTKAVVLSRDDESRAELARYHKGSLGIVGSKHKPRLDVDPAVEHMLDLIVLTFVYVEKIRTDKDGENTGP